MKRGEDRIEQTVLRTERLLLRPFRMTDADALAALANDREVALNTLSIPHPYARRDAQDWIASQEGQLERLEAVSYAVTVLADGSLAGAVGLVLEPENDAAELGYWIGREYWGRGFATEASRALIAWAFHTLDLHRIHAAHFPRNPASGRVLRKLGMRHEGTLREHIKKWGEYVDLEKYGLLRSDHDGSG